LDGRTGLALVKRIIVRHRTASKIQRPDPPRRGASRYLEEKEKELDTPLGDRVKVSGRKKTSLNNKQRLRRTLLSCAAFVSLDLGGRRKEAKRPFQSKRRYQKKTVKKPGLEPKKSYKPKEGVKSNRGEFKKKGKKAILLIDLPVRGT